MCNKSRSIHFIGMCILIFEIMEHLLGDIQYIKREKEISNFFIFKYIMTNNPKNKKSRKSIETTYNWKEGKREHDKLKFFWRCLLLEIKLI